MRNLVALIILAAGGYFGWKAWQDQPDWLVRVLPKPVSTTSSRASTEGVNDPSSELPPFSATTREAASPSTPARPRVATPPTPNFVSRIRPSTAGGDPSRVAPGRFLIIERASVETKDGVIAVVPGDEVRLMERHKNGTLTVTNGQAEFIVKESQVTQDIATAQAAEMHEFQKRFGRTR